jgi:CubicO group peptidase (beta-lactamase class C family)
MAVPAVRLLLAGFSMYVTFLQSAVAGAPEPPIVASATTLVERMQQTTDATLGSLVREGRSSFAMAVFVADGKVQVERNFGYEDPVTMAPLSTASLVDLNSLKKLFVAVAVAQLLDRGVIHNINDPINSYLKSYQLPERAGREVTIREVATHNAGFDFSVFGSGSQVADPHEYFAERFPGYFDNTGPYSAYSNYGSMLLADMVGEASGMPFTRYVREQILRPLNMQDTWFGPPAPQLKHRIVSFQPQARDNIVVGEPLESRPTVLPTGQWVATAHDIGQLMIALVGSGSESAVVTPSMRERIFKVYQSNGAAGSQHGLEFEAMRVGSTLLFNHGGIGTGLDCLLSLEPVQKVGLFYCYGVVKSRPGEGVTPLPRDYELIKSVMLTPIVGHTVEPGKALQAATSDRPSEYTGLYISYARHHHGLLRFRSVLYPDTIRVEKSDHSLSFNGVGGFVEVRPGVFANPSFLETFDFTRDPATGAVVLSGSGHPTAYERPGLVDDPAVMPRLLAGLGLISLCGGFLVILPGSSIKGSARLSVAAPGTLVVLFVGVLFGLHAFGRAYFDGLAWPLDILRILAFLMLPASAALIIVASRINRAESEGVGLLGKLHVNLICAASILLVIALLALDLITFDPVV